MKHAKIAGISYYVPEKILTNVDLEKMVDTSDAWITERSGIKERHIAAEGELTSDMATNAGRAACKQAGVEPSELDAIIVGTVTPDMPMPATAAFVQQKLGVKNIPAFDISAACAGFIYGMGIADGLICRGNHRRILVIGVELLSRVVDWTDRNTCVLFGDAAGAAVVVPTEIQDGLLGVAMHTDGLYAKDLEIPGGGSRYPTSQQTLTDKQHLVKMNGRQIFTQAVRNMSGASLALLEQCGYSPMDITTVFAHQANLRILEGVSQRTRIPLERFFINIHKYGNTSSASIPIAMTEALAEGRLTKGDLILLTALGAGVSWGAALIRW